MHNFHIKFMLDADTLKVHDETCRLSNVCVVEFVTYTSNGVSTVSAKSKEISLGNHACDYRYEVEKDGRYTYYKVILPYYGSFDDCGLDVNIPYGYFVAENANGVKIICLNDKNSVSLKNGESIEIKEVKNYLDLITSGLLSPSEYFSKEFFSIWKLNECVAKMQKKFILKHADDCGSLKCIKGSDADKANRDFLFITSYVLDHLIEEGDFDQAEELLDKIKSCSGTLCDDDNINKNCNCNA